MCLIILILTYVCIILYVFYFDVICAIKKL